MDTIHVSDFIEHVQTRSMWKGSREVSTNEAWMRNSEGRFVRTKADFSEALMKCFDEVIVNTLDQYIDGIERGPELGGPVTEIMVDFNRATGELTIRNDGKGFPVYKHEKLAGRYSVEGMLTREFTGTNFNEAKNPDKVVGGVNGLGLKLVIIDATRFEIETVDTGRGIYYAQRISDRMKTIAEPTVVDLRDIAAVEAARVSEYMRRPHTTIRFLPAYADLCHKGKNLPDPAWACVKNFETLAKLLEFRLYESAAFIAAINYRYEGARRISYTGRKAKVYYNGGLIPITTLGDFAKMFGLEARECVEMVFESPDDRIRFPWYVLIGMNPHRTFSQVTLLNAVHLSAGGSHTDMLLGKITAALEAKAARMAKESSVKLTDTLLRNFFFMINCKQLPTPSFGGQSKEKVTIGKTDLNRLKELFEPDKKAVDKLWKLIKDKLEAMLLERDQKAGEKTATKSGVDRAPVRKYEKPTEPRRAGVKRWLFGPEGDSAAKPIRNILTAKGMPVSIAHAGIFNLNGVPMNALKKIKELVGADGKTIIKKDKELTANQTLSGLVRVLKLSYDHSYWYAPDSGPGSDGDMDAMSPDDRVRRLRGDAEYKTLAYDCFVLATDQDFDGIGQITGLMLVFFLVFWPHLIKRRFLARLATPLIRTYHGKKVKNFYSQREYDAWVQSEYGGLSGMPSGMSTRYYKGLAGHTTEEVLKDIGKNLLDNIYAFRWDETAAGTMQLYYGTGTAGRKRVLGTPITAEYDPKDADRMLIRVTDHFEIETKAFQLDFMRRKLKCAIDGMIPSQRKALTGMRVMFHNKDRAKVYQVTGYVTNKMQYEHGDASMNETIIKMAQCYTGTNNIPIAVACSDGFGSRVDDRSETGSPRYIDCRYNRKAMDLLFPPVDDWLLRYTFENQQRCEPEFYVPIFPVAIAETSTTVSAGWSIKVWARDFNALMENLRLMIEGDYPDEMGQPLPMTGQVWIRDGMRVSLGRYRTGTRDTEICHGTYTLKKDATGDYVHVTQLPLKIWSYHLKCTLLGIDVANGKTEDRFGKPLPRKELVTDVIDASGNDLVDMRIYLAPGALDKIKAEYGHDTIDAIEDYLGLTTDMGPALNMITARGYVREFRDYVDVMCYWFEYRKALYIRRITRLTKLLELRIMYQREVIRFIEMEDRKEIAINVKLADEARVQVLVDAAFCRFNLGMLERPEYCHEDRLEEEILVTGADYEYIERINTRDRSEAALEKRRAKLAAMEEELATLQGETWRSLWLKELDAFARIVPEGIETSWLFGDRLYEYEGRATKKGAAPAAAAKKGGRAKK